MHVQIHVINKKNGTVMTGLQETTNTFSNL